MLFDMIEIGLQEVELKPKNLAKIFKKYKV